MRALVLIACCLLLLVTARPVEKRDAPTNILGTIPDPDLKLQLHTDGEFPAYKPVSVLKKFTQALFLHSHPTIKLQRPTSKWHQ